MKRQSGILMPIFSLPGKFGAGDFGKVSYDFIDYLESANQKIWQILPLVQTGYGNSPYSSVSSESFNPYYISLEKLYEQKLLTKKELDFAKADDFYIDYGKLYEVRYLLLRKAFYRFDKSDKAFKKFIRNKEFYDYALFMAIKEHCGYKPFYEWEDGYKYRDERALDKFVKANREEILFRQFLQFTAKTQWLELKNYANKKGISIMGDMPLYVAWDSVDVWTNPSLFKLDRNLTPTKVAGVPPDYFSKTGQLWGNPVYNYQDKSDECISWWTNRLKKALQIFDYVRIDHFRGLDRYYEIPFGAETAINGEWVKVPSERLFNSVHKVIDGDRIIAEDLGIIDDGVKELLSFTGYPGMKILSFAFNGDKGNLYLPENVTENSVCYTGTHDNDTLLGLINGFSEWDKNNLVTGVVESLKTLKINKKITDDISLVKAVIELGFKCKSNTFILPMQDVATLGTEYRINEPGTVKAQNWAVRIPKSAFNKKSLTYLKNLTLKYQRKG
ncbi:MAG: 4-alpha-glucanotransferase [Clostridiales bacterium]|nr:4-alpha-glucanotransferase [Clostridiales bacterium]